MGCAFAEDQISVVFWFVSRVDLRHIYLCRLEKTNDGFGIKAYPKHLVTSKAVKRMTRKLRRRVQVTCSTSLQEEKTQDSNAVNNLDISVYRI